MDIFEGTPNDSKGWRKISNTFKYGQWKGHKDCPY